MRPENRDEKKHAPAPDGVDAWLRERLEPPPQQVARLVHRALRGEPAPPASRPLTWGLSAATAMAVLALAFLGLGLFAPRPITKDGRTTGPGMATAIITNASGKVELITPDGSLQRDMGPAGDPGPKGGTIHVFNADGCLCAMLPSGPVRYYIIGGDV